MEIVHVIRAITEMENQILCGGILITKKKAKNAAIYLEFSRKTQRVCVFEGEWTYMKESGSAVHKEETFSLSDDKKLVPDTFHNRKVVWLALNNGYKFYMSADDYEMVMRNVDCIDRMLNVNNQQPLYYTWKPNTSGSFMQESQFFNNKRDCENDAVQKNGSGKYHIVSHKLEVKSPAQLAYYIYTYVLERLIEESAQKQCSGCDGEQYGDAYDYKTHSIGCLAEWEYKLDIYLDEVKSSVSEHHVADLFFKISAHHGFPTHPHMINIISTIMEYVNITADLLKTHEYDPVLQHVIQRFYECKN